MKIALIGHGAMPIPPKGWGAVEGTIWNRKVHLERVGHSVDIFNSRGIHTVIAEINRGGYDFVHCHNEMVVLQCLAHLTVPLAVTSHTAITRLPSGDYDYPGATKYLWKDTLRAPANIVLSDPIKSTYLRAGYSGLLRVLRNAAEVGSFRLAAHGNGKAICLGRFSTRKRQAWLGEIARDRVPVDFVGPLGSEKEAGFAEHDMARYLGPWNRETLHERLTDYGCLVLLSRTEGAPKVVPEAFAAGLSVVVSEACVANLADKEFITIIPDDEERPEFIAEAIQCAIDKNAALRDDIRGYAWERFDYSVVCQDYLSIIAEAQEFFGQEASRVRPPRGNQRPALRHWAWRQRRRLLEGRSLAKYSKKRRRAVAKKFRSLAKYAKTPRGALQRKLRSLAKLVQGKRRTLRKKYVSIRPKKRAIAVMRRMSEFQRSLWSVVTTRPTRNLQTLRRFAFNYRYRRPPQVGFPERVAELRIAMRYGLDLDMFKAPAPGKSKRDTYRLLSPGPVLWQFRPRVEAIRIPYWMRFGNAVQQLGNAFHIAEKLGVETIQLVETHPIITGEHAGQFHIAWGDGPTSVPTLEGEFFFVDFFRLKPRAADTAHIYVDLVRPLLIPQVRTPDPRLREDDLVLHFRAGDIFRESNVPHAGYGQPPLSFYLSAVEREQPARVWLVFEDRGNPCIDAAASALRARGIDVCVQSGTLDEDLRVLMTARRLVFGHSSFARFGAYMSERLAKAYVFDEGRARVLRVRGVELVVAKDIDGEFMAKVRSNNWSNSPEQRALLLAYPADKLAFTQSSAAGKVARDVWV